jgi:tetratricopeptide (TPR) repeat protein
MNFTKIFSIALIFFTLISISLASAQSSSELIQKGFSDYQKGDYQSAIKDFDKAIANSKTSSEKHVDTESPQTMETKQKTETSISKREQVETSEKSYIDVSKRELVDTEVKKYESTPLEYQGDEPAKLYLYRGRTYLKAGNKDAALRDFDKAISLDPNLSEVYFRRALENTKVDPSKACPDLVEAMNRGYKSAKELYDLICK